MAVEKNLKACKLNFLFFKEKSNPSRCLNWLAASESANTILGRFYDFIFLQPICAYRDQKM